MDWKITIMTNKHGRTTGEDILHEIQLVRGRKTSDRLCDILADLADGIRLAIFVGFGSVILAVGWLASLWDNLEAR